MHRVIPSFVLLLGLVGLVPGQSSDDKNQSVAFVRGLQAKDGGFLAARGQAKSSLRATTGALRALKYFGGKPADTSGAADFVKRCFDAKAGGFADHPGDKLEVFATAAGLMNIKELGIDPQPYHATAVGYLRRHARTFDEIRITAAGIEAAGDEFLPEDGLTARFLAVMELQRLDTGTAEESTRQYAQEIVTLMRLTGNKMAEKNPKAPSAANLVLKLRQGADGGFGNLRRSTSDLDTCYMVMRAFHMLRAKPDVRGMRSFVASCRNDDGGYGVAPGKPSTVPATYYAAIILHWLDQK